MREYRYAVVDVFTAEPLLGNALAVFPDASGLDAGTMQRIARELNLAETAFVLPAARSGSAARVRIFTPGLELPFAGHPTLGTAAVLCSERADLAGAAAFVLEEEIGAVSIRVERGQRTRYWLRSPAVADGPAFAPGACAEALGVAREDLLDLEPRRLSAGNPTLLVALQGRAAVDRARLDAAGLARLAAGDPVPFCVYVFAAEGAGVYGRMFAPAYGITEDPATGSSMGPLAVYLRRHGLLPGGAQQFTCIQGQKMGRRSVLHVAIGEPGDADAIWIGGEVSPVARATLTLPG